MPDVPEDYVSFTLAVAVHVDDAEFIDFLRAQATERPGKVLWIEAAGDERSELVILDVLTTQGEDEAIAELYGVTREDDENA